MNFLNIETIDGDDVSINIDHITHIFSKEEYVRICFMNNTFINTNE